ncbi:cation diffusion facilitator family transporter [Aeromicrobium sp. 636]|uniref:Cation transporter n=1 Tax=Aeromicrobium senzhongii TaxID=2663859 RepID=A0A8I0EXS5_9ACTN|nr:cation diffusion facilitator family transporter [Aeromicrobium sp. 636]MBC9227398.1 cation transporter [Aeromicrobium senzhongii]MCQ3999495.1 cation diffusion facilitator family transporter [Aeromicrobium sp. 636]
MGHDHAHGAGVKHRGRLGLVLALTLSVLVLQVVVGLVTGSLALLADAGHLLSDSFGLVLALAAIAVAQRPAGARSTYGFHRTEVLAAGLNALILIGLCVAIVIGAVRRLEDPPAIEGGWVLAAGLVGLVVNVVGLLVLRSGAQESLNVRGAYLEVMGDALGSVAVIGSAVVILATSWYPADPLASLLIAALIVPRAVSLLRDVAEVLLEASPRDVDLDAVRNHILGVRGVVDVHDLHVWTITSGMPVMSAHVVVDESVVDMGDAHAVLDQLGECLSGHFDVAHSTFQLEPAGHLENESHRHR